MDGVKRPRLYGAANKKKSIRAVFSVFLGVLSLASGWSVFYRSGKNGGETFAGDGLVMSLCLVFSVTGMILSLRAVQEEDSLLILPYSGIVLNGLMLAVCCMVLYMGLS